MGDDMIDAFRYMMMAKGWDRPPLADGEPAVIDLVKWSADEYVQPDPSLEKTMMRISFGVHSKSRDYFIVLPEHSD